MKTWLAASTALFAATVQAHEGHGLPGTSHWHATDVVGVVLAVAAGAMAVWWMRRK